MPVEDKDMQVNQMKYIFELATEKLRLTRRKKDVVAELSWIHYDRLNIVETGKNIDRIVKNMF